MVAGGVAVSVAFPEYIDGCAWRWHSGAVGGPSDEDAGSPSVTWFPVGDAAGDAENGGKGEALVRVTVRRVIGGLAGMAVATALLIAGTGVGSAAAQQGGPGTTPKFKATVLTRPDSATTKAAKPGSATSWSAQAGSAAAMAGAGAAARIGVVQWPSTTSPFGTASVKEGSLGAAWSLSVAPVDPITVAQLMFTGDRIGVVGRYDQAVTGPFAVLEGDLSDPGNDFATVADNVRRGVLAGNRIGVVDSAGRVRVKEGGLWAAWTDEGGDARDVVLAGNRIGVLTADNRLLVKEGSLDAAWSEVASDVGQFAMTQNRIGIVTLSGVASIKEGTIDAGWTTQFTPAWHIEVAGTRIGVLTGFDATATTSYNALDATVPPTFDSHAIVKDGALSASWSDVASSAYRMALTPTRVGIVDGNRHALVKEGALGAAWSDELDQARWVALS